MAPRRRASLKDVAALAGVSTATVSRAVNFPRLLDPATLERVRAAVERLQYVPHAAARALRSRRTFTIGAVVPSFDYALYARTTSALQRRLDAKGYALVLAAHHYDISVEARISARLIERGVEAFMFVGTEHRPELFALLADSRRPYVLTWGVDRDGAHPSIGFDNYAATFALASRLVELGHRRFGLITAPIEGNDRARERSAGIRAALAAHGLELTEGAVHHLPIELASGTEAMQRILALPQRPTAVMATNDVFAVGAMLACREAGVRIPDEVSITGVDNTDLGATQSPSLTSISTPIVEIGEAAADYLVARLEGGKPKRRSLLPFSIVERGSIGPPRGRKA